MMMRGGARVLPALAALFAVTALIGWAFDIGVLRSLIDGRVPMRAQTALVLLVGAAGVAAHLIERWRAARFVGLALIAISGATLIDYALHGAAATTELWRERMALQTAGCVFVLGFGLLMSDPASQEHASLCDGIHGVRRRPVSRLNIADPLRISRVVRRPVKSRNPWLGIARRALNRGRAARARDGIATASRT